MDGNKAAVAKDKQYDRTCASLFEKICRKYDNLEEVDKLASVTKKVDAVKLVMQGMSSDNIGHYSVFSCSMPMFLQKMLIWLFKIA